MNFCWHQFPHPKYTCAMYTYRYRYTYLYLPLSLSITISTSTFWLARTRKYVMHFVLQIGSCILHRPSCNILYALYFPSPCPKTFDSFVVRESVFYICFCNMISYIIRHYRLLQLQDKVCKTILLWHTGLSPTMISLNCTC